MSRSEAASGATPADIGLELLWLAEVLPPAARGDYQPFESTGTPSRQMARQALAELCQMDAATCQQLMEAIDANRSVLEAELLSLFQSLP